MRALKDGWNDETDLKLSEYAVGAGLITIAIIDLVSKINVGITTTCTKIKRS